MGYFGIGIYNAKTEENLGTLMRSAMIFNASYVFTIKHRYRKQASDTFNVIKNLPYYHYENFEDFYKYMPKDCKFVGIELDEKAEKIETYKHFDRSIYLLGSEDNGLPQGILSKCHDIVQLPGNLCMNVATAGSIVLYDRHVKNQTL